MDLLFEFTAIFKLLSIIYQCGLIIDAISILIVKGAKLWAILRASLNDLDATRVSILIFGEQQNVQWGYTDSIDVTNTIPRGWVTLSTLLKIEETFFRGVSNVISIIFRGQIDIVVI